MAEEFKRITPPPPPSPSRAYNTVALRIKINNSIQIKLATGRGRESNACLALDGKFSGRMIVDNPVVKAFGDDFCPVQVERRRARRRGKWEGWDFGRDGSAMPYYYRYASSAGNKTPKRSHL